MSINDQELVTAANKKLNRKIFICWAIAALTFLLCLLFDTWANSISLWTAKYIPSVAKLTTKPSLLGGFTGKYFGVACLLIPIFSLVYMWRENVLARFRYAQPRSGRSLFEAVIFVYVLGLPFIALLFFVLYIAPIEIAADPRLSGQVVLHVMLNSYLGLFIFGTLLITFLPVISATFIGFLWLPFATAINHFSSKEIK
jgi:hypothetical protein